MNNKSRQQLLDEEKWLASEQVGYDKAGSMDWCDYCKAQKECVCMNKEKDTTTCATAYNKMKKAEKKN